MLSRTQPVVMSTPGQAHPVDTFTTRTGSKSQLKNLNELLKIDLLESHSDYHLKADLPGIERDCLEVLVENGYLVIKGESKNLVHSKDDIRFHQLERGVGKVERYIHIPGDADTGLISSELKDGVLSISIPKKESAKGRIKIPVRFSR